MNEVHTPFTVAPQCFEDFNASGLKVNPNLILLKAQFQSHYFGEDSKMILTPVNKCKASIHFVVTNSVPK